MRKTLKKIGATVLVLSFSLLSCDNDHKEERKSICNVTNPTKELTWLKEAINEVQQDEYSYYVMADYNGQTVFYYGNCNPAVNYTSVVLDCNGETVGFTNDVKQDLTQRTIVWKHQKSKCTF